MALDTCALRNEGRESGECFDGPMGFRNPQQGWVPTFRGWSRSVSSPFHEAPSRGPTLEITCPGRLVIRSVQQPCGSQLALGQCVDFHEGISQRSVSHEQYASATPLSLQLSEVWTLEPQREVRVSSHQPSTYGVPGDGRGPSILVTCC